METEAAAGGDGFTSAGGRRRRRRREEEERKGEDEEMAEPRPRKRPAFPALPAESLGVSGERGGLGSGPAEAPGAGS